MPKKSKTKLGKLQAVLIPKDIVKDASEAIAVADKFGRVKKLEHMEKFYRCRINEGAKTFYTRHAKRGIQLVYGGANDNEID